jgi:hypothetical protein
MNNCLTCKYEPTWQPTSKADCATADACFCPAALLPAHTRLSFLVRLIPEDEIWISAVVLGASQSKKMPGCPAHQPKEAAQ